MGLPLARTALRRTPSRPPPLRSRLKRSAPRRSPRRVRSRAPARGSRCNSRLHSPRRSLRLPTRRAPALPPTLSLFVFFSLPPFMNENRPARVSFQASFHGVPNSARLPFAPEAAADPRRPRGPLPRPPCAPSHPCLAPRPPCPLAPPSRRAALRARSPLRACIHGFAWPRARSRRVGSVLPPFGPPLPVTHLNPPFAPLLSSPRPLLPPLLAAPGCSLSHLVISPVDRTSGRRAEECKTTPEPLCLLRFCRPSHGVNSARRGPVRPVPDGLLDDPRLPRSAPTSLLLCRLPASSRLSFRTSSPLAVALTPCRPWASPQAVRSTVTLWSRRIPATF